jgi:4-carboxymuconolactone decarboxylase
MKKYFIRTAVTSMLALCAGLAQAQATPPATAAPQAQQPTVNQRLLGDFAPKFVDLTDNTLFADIWERPGLSKRDRSLVTVAALVAMNRSDQLRFHLANARKNGVTEAELVEATTHLAFYAGWPSAYSAMTLAKEVLATAPASAAPAQAPAR